MIERTYEYENYIGDNDFVVVRCTKNDMTKCVSVVNNLARKGLKLFFDVDGCRDSADAESLADAISTCESALFFISKKSCESLGYRNSINYALELKKNVVYVALEDNPLAFGLEMQLANVNSIMLSDDIDKKLKEFEVITQDTLGGCPKKKQINIKKKILMLVSIILILIAFAISATLIIKDRIAFYNSPEWVLRNVDNSSYVNISEFGKEGIEALKGKKVDELDLTASNIDELSGIEDIDITTLNLTDCSNLHNLKEIKKCKNLKTVKLSQDMVKYIRDLKGLGIEYEITK